jgi:hypothetical protein
MGRSYKLYINGGMSMRMLLKIKNEVIPRWSASDHYPFEDQPYYYYDKISNIRDYRRGTDEATFIIDIASPPVESPFSDDDDFYDAVNAYFLADIEQYRNIFERVDIP